MVIDDSSSQSLINEISQLRISPSRFATLLSDPSGLRPIWPKMTCFQPCFWPNCKVSTIERRRMSPLPIDGPLVQPLHPIDEIAARIWRADGDGVRLKRERNTGSVNEHLQRVDPAAAVAQALDEPLEFPPLAAGIVPGDRVAIAVDSAVPC